MQEAVLEHPPLSRLTIARLAQAAGLFDAVTAVFPPRHGRIAQLMEFVPSAGILSARTATALIVRPVICGARPRLRWAGGANTGYGGAAAEDGAR